LNAALPDGLPVRELGRRNLKVTIQNKNVATWRTAWANEKEARRAPCSLMIPDRTRKGQAYSSTYAIFIEQQNAAGGHFL
jgi:hypothetical protein